jgi:hypothetical protein
MLYDILANRVSVNILKVLSDNEKKKSYSTNINEIVGNREQVEVAVVLLSSEGLIYKEDQLLSISEKGKKFIDAFDKLVVVFKNEQLQEKENIEIKYDLTEFEKKVLFTLFRLYQETGEDVALATLTQELFPYENPERRKLRTSKELKKLEQLNLAKKIKKERNVYAEITDSGMKVIKRQIESEVKKVL